MFMLHMSKGKNIGPNFGTNVCISLMCVLCLNGASAKAASWTACLPAESVCCQMQAASKLCLTIGLWVILACSTVVLSTICREERSSKRAEVGLGVFSMQ